MNEIFGKKVILRKTTEKDSADLIGLWFMADGWAGKQQRDRLEKPEYMIALRRNLKPMIQ